MEAGGEVYALTDYYEGGRDHYRAWMEAAFGYNDIIGSHAGIGDVADAARAADRRVRT